MLRRSTLEIPNGSGIGGITSFSSSTYMQIYNTYFQQGGVRVI